MLVFDQNLVTSAATGRFCASKLGVRNYKQVMPLQLKDWVRYPRRASRKISLAHQVTVAFARRATALIESPNDQALTSATVAGCEDALDIGRVLFEVSFDIRTGIAF